MISAEIAMQRVQTKAFIDADSIDIILSRATSVATGSGGSRQGIGFAGLPQTVRMIPSSGNKVERELVDGQVVTVDYTVLGEWNFDVQRGDWFYLGGLKFEVVTVGETGHYEIKAEVTNRG